MKQPDLGTAMMVMMVGGAMFFAGRRAAVEVRHHHRRRRRAVPVAWQFLHDYQKNRVLTFLNPESDPLGAGYHITQSKIALGSGGCAGKGFLQGRRATSNFLPEKQTDFIFTMLGGGVRHGRRHRRCCCSTAC